MSLFVLLAYKQKAKKLEILTFSFSLICAFFGLNALKGSLLSASYDTKPNILVPSVFMKFTYLIYIFSILKASGGRGR